MKPNSAVQGERRGVMICGTTGCGHQAVTSCPKCGRPLCGDEGKGMYKRTGCWCRCQVQPSLIELQTRRKEYA